MAKRVCVKEEYTEYGAAGCARLFRVKKWVYTYSDGTTEAVAVRKKLKKVYVCCGEELDVDLVGRYGCPYCCGDNTPKEVLL